MICKLKKTGKNSTEETPENECECLGYPAIDVHGVLEFRYEKMSRGVLSTGLIMDCEITFRDGKKKFMKTHWSDIESDIRNGYLVPA